MTNIKWKYLTIAAAIPAIIVALVVLFPTFFAFVTLFGLFAVIVLMIYKLIEEYGTDKN